MLFIKDKVIMKRLFLLSVLVLGLMTACNQNDVDPTNIPNPEIPNQGSKKIKSILLTKWDVSGQKQRFIEQDKTVFDEQGRIIEEVKYHNSGKERERMVYKYNERDLNTESTLYQVGKLRYHYKMTYNEADKLIQKDCLSADNTLEVTNKLSYDADGSVLDMLYYKGEVSEVKRSIYNAKGLLVKLLYLDQDKNNKEFNIVSSLEVYEYNAKGLMTLKAIYSGSDVTDSSKLEEKKVWTYDDKSILKTYELYGANNELRVKIIYTNEIDEYGNWIELLGKTEQWGGNSPTFIERKIEYFD